MPAFLIGKFIGTTVVNNTIQMPAPLLQPQQPQSSHDQKYSEYWLNELKASTEETRQAFCSNWPIPGETRWTLENKAKRFERAAQQFGDDPRVKQHILDVSEPLNVFPLIYGDVERFGQIRDIDKPYYNENMKTLDTNLSEIEKAIPFLKDEMAPQ